MAPHDGRSTLVMGSPRRLLSEGSPADRRNVDRGDDVGGGQQLVAPRASSRDLKKSDFIEAA
jgi:hypothetical protein